MVTVYQLLKCNTWRLLTVTFCFCPYHLFFLYLVYNLGHVCLQGFSVLFKRPERVWTLGLYNRKEESPAWEKLKLAFILLTTPERFFEPYQSTIGETLDDPLSYVMLYNLLVSPKMIQITLFQSLGSNVWNTCCVLILYYEDIQEEYCFAFIDIIIRSIFLSNLVDICRYVQYKTQFLCISYLNHITHKIYVFHSTSV